MSNIIISPTQPIPEQHSRPRASSNFDEVMEKESNVHHGADKQNQQIKEKDTSATDDNESADHKDNSEESNHENSKNNRSEKDGKTSGKSSNKANNNDAIAILEDGLFASVPVEAKPVSINASISTAPTNILPTATSLIDPKAASVTTPSVSNSSNNLDFKVINGGQSVTPDIIDQSDENAFEDIVQQQTQEDTSALKKQIISKLMAGPNGSVVQKIESVSLDTTSVSKTDTSVVVSATTPTVDTPNSAVTEKFISEKTHILDKKWAADISAKIALNSVRGMTNIRAKINPVSMGPIEILITKVDDVANITISVASMATRDLLNSGSDRLIQSLEDAGMELGSFDINHQDQPSSNDNDFSEGKSKNGYQEELSIDEVIVDNLSLIDSYA